MLICRGEQRAWARGAGSDLVTGTQESLQRRGLILTMGNATVECGGEF